MRNPWKKLLANVKISGRVGLAYAALREGGDPEKVVRHDIAISWQDLERKFAEQNKRCFWLGIPLNPEWIFKTHYPMAPSVDRLDNEKDYTYDNTVICSRFANLARGRCSARSFAKIMMTLAKRGLTPNEADMEKIINFPTKIEGLSV